MVMFETVTLLEKKHNEQRKDALQKQIFNVYFIWPYAENVTRETVPLFPVYGLLF